MATLALTVAGYVLGGMVGAPWLGAVVGGAVGGYIDRAFIFKPDSVSAQGPRLGDFQIQTASEGSPMRYCIGPKNRTAGTLIWMPKSGLIEESNTQSSGGGKGGGGASSSFTTYTYFAHVMVGVCERLPVGGKITKIWADGKLIYKEPVTTTLASSTLLSAARKNVYTQVLWPPPTQWTAKNYTVIHSPVGGPDISVFKSGLDVTVSGFANNNISFTTTQARVYLDPIDGYMIVEFPSDTPVDLSTFQVGTNVTTSAFANIQNNGVWNCLAKGYTNGTNIKTYVKLANAGAIAENAGANITISQTAPAGNNGSFLCEKVVSNADGSKDLWLLNPNAITQAAGSPIILSQTTNAFDPSLVSDIRFYIGGPAQATDALVESYEGAANTPAYRGTCSVLFEKLALQNFGNRIPQLQFLVQAEASKTLSSAISDILIRSGLSGGDFTIGSSIDSLMLDGYIVVGPQSTVSTLEPLLMAFDIIAQDKGSALNFFERGDEQTIIVDSDDLAAREFEAERPAHLSVTDVPGFDLPNQVNVHYFDPSFQLQSATMVQRRTNQVTDGVVDMNIPITMSSTQARKIALRNLRRPWSDRLSGTVFLPPSYFDIEEGDIVKVTDNGKDFRIRAIEVVRGNNLLIEVNGVIENTGTFSFPDPDGADDPNVTDPTVYTPPPVTLLVMNLAPLLDDHTTTLGYYMAVCASDPLATWQGAGVFISSDGSSYSLLEPMPLESTIVRAVTALGSGPVSYWDRHNTVDVEVLHGTLSSKTALEVLNGDNRMMLGGEIIAFQTATLIDTNRYRLSMLLRGCRDTGDAVGGHAINELGVLFSSATMAFESFNQTILDFTRYFKAVPTGGDITTIDAQSSQLIGQTCYPFSPAHLKGYRNVANDLEIDWVRRTRAIIRLFGLGGAPLLDSDETYEIDILDANDLVVRTMTVADDTTVTYTAAEQTSDGLTPGNPVKVKVYQTNTVVGRGKYASATL